MLRAWKVYGKDGKKQKKSFEKSKKMTEGDATMWIFNKDITRTNNYTYIRVEAETEDECEELLEKLIKKMEYGKIKEACASYMNEKGILLKVGDMYRVDQLTDADGGILEEILESGVVYIGIDSEDMPMFAEFEDLDKEREDKMLWEKKIIINDIW